MTEMGLKIDMDRSYQMSGLCVTSDRKKIGLAAHTASMFGIINDHNLTQVNFISYRLLYILKSYIFRNYFRRINFGNPIESL